MERCKRHSMRLLASFPEIMKRSLRLGVNELGIHGANPLGGKTQQPLHELDSTLRIRSEKCPEFLTRNPPDETFAAGNDGSAGTGRVEDIHLAEGITCSQCRDQKRSFARRSHHMQHSG